MGNDLDDFFTYSFGDEGLELEKVNYDSPKFVYTSSRITSDEVKKLYDEFTRTTRTYGHTVTVPNLHISTDRVICKDAIQLNADNILQQLSVLHLQLQEKCIALTVDHVECYMTPIVKENLLKACRRLKMYGKEKAVIARFDINGNRLPDEPNIDVLKGVKIEIVDPDEYGEFYLSFRGVGAIPESPF